MSKSPAPHSPASQSPAPAEHTPVSSATPSLKPKLSCCRTSAATGPAGFTSVTSATRSFTTCLVCPITNRPTWTKEGSPAAGATRCSSQPRRGTLTGCSTGCRTSPARCATRRSALRLRCCDTCRLTLWREPSPATTAASVTRPSQVNRHHTCTTKSERFFRVVMFLPPPLANLIICIYVQYLSVLSRSDPASYPPAHTHFPLIPVRPVQQDVQLSHRSPFASREPHQREPLSVSAVRQAL